VREKRQQWQESTSRASGETGAVQTVSWDVSWDTPGGDWDRSLSAYGIAEVGSAKTVELDVTEFARGWLKEPLKNFGVIVKVSGPFVGTFSTEGPTQEPRLRILYSNE